jgi:hypothetical protein
MPEDSLSDFTEVLDQQEKRARRGKKLELLAEAASQVVEFLGHVFGHWT